MKLWIARDHKGFLGLYRKTKPVWNERLFMGDWDGDYMGYLPEGCFPKVTFENSPQEVELKLINEIVGVAESPLKTFPRVNEFEVGASYRR